MNICGTYEELISQVLFKIHRRLNCGSCNIFEKQITTIIITKMETIMISVVFRGLCNIFEKITTIIITKMEILKKISVAKI